MGLCLEPRVMAFRRDRGGMSPGRSPGFGFWWPGPLGFWSGVDQGDLRDVPLEFWLSGVVTKSQREDFDIPGFHGGLPPAVSGAFVNQNDMADTNTFPASGQTRRNRGYGTNRCLVRAAVRRCGELVRLAL